MTVASQWQPWRTLRYENTTATSSATTSLSTPLSDNHSLNTKLTIEEIRALLKCLNPQKALGPEFIPLAQWSRLTQITCLKDQISIPREFAIASDLVSKCCSVLQKIFNEGSPIPAWMKQSRLTTLSKTGTPNCKLEDIRHSNIRGLH